MNAVVERYEGLEPTTENLRMLIGDVALRQLVAVYGGCELYLRRAPGPHHPLTQAIGQDAADQMAAAFQGEAIMVPRGMRGRHGAVAEIHRLNALGETRRTIARTVGVTERWVYMVLQGAKTPAPRAPDLFDER